MIRRGATGGDRFAQILNAALQDTRLSYRARGILACVVSRPPAWTGSAETLSDDSPSEGRDAIRRALRELEAAGYLRRVKAQGDKGRWETHWDITDDPTLHAPQQTLPLDLAKPQVAPGTDFQSSADQSSVDRPSVDQASSKHGYQTRSVPNGTGASRSPEQVIASAVYEHTEGMVEFMAVQGIAKRALRVAGATPERITEAMIAVYTAGKPITLQTVGQQIAGRQRQSGAEAPSTQRVMELEQLRTGGQPPQLEIGGVG